MDIYPIYINYKKQIFTIKDDISLVSFINTNARINPKTAFVDISEDFRKVIISTNKNSFRKTEFLALVNKHGEKCLNEKVLLWRGYTSMSAKSVLDDTNSNKINLYDYKQVISYKNITEDAAKEYVKTLLGKNITPRNTQYWINRNYTLEEAIEKVSEVQSLSGKKYGECYRKDPEKYKNKITTNIEYWKEKYGQIVGAELYKERQSTFSLDRCIKKYGIEKGEEVWRERQRSWQSSMSAKDKSEIERINKARGRNKRGNPHSPKKTSNEPCNLYFVKFYNKDVCFYKIGITKYNLEDRFWMKGKKHKSKLEYDSIVFKNMSSEKEAYQIEQRILSDFCNKRVSIKIEGFKTSEAFYERIDIEKYI